jgi:hypothetical protein
MVIERLVPKGGGLKERTNAPPRERPVTNKRRESPSGKLQTAFINFIFREAFLGPFDAL